MIELPWQVVAAFVALFGLNLVLTYLKKVNCDDRVEAAKRMQHRDTMTIYREAYRFGWVHGEQDGQRLIVNSEDVKDA